MANTPTLNVPHSEELERAVLGGILHEPALYADVRAVLAAKDFYMLRHVYVFEAMTRLAQRGDDLNLINVADELTAQGRLSDIGGSYYLAQCVGETPNVSATENFARKVADYAYRRRLLNAGDSLRKLALVADMDPAVLRAQSEAILEAADDGTEDVPVVSMAQEMGHYFEEVEATQDSDEALSGLATGYRDYDDILDGLQPGSLNLFAGRPGMGKSAALLCIALNAAKAGKRVYVWSGEMPRAQLRQRLMSVESGIPGRILQRGLRAGGMSPAAWRTFVHESGNLAKLPIYLDDAEDMTPALLKARVERLARRIGGLDLIIVDYIGLMEAGFKKENRNNEVSFITRKLKKLGKVAPVLAAAQLNRDLERRQDKRPQLSDLRDSGSLEQDADTVSFVYRPVVYDETADAHRIDFIVAKNRHGMTGTVALYFEKSLTKITSAHARTIDFRNL